jgi:hypothetical protein
MKNIKLSPRIIKFSALLVIVIIILYVTISSIIYVFERKEAVVYSLTNYEDTMLMKQTTDGIDGNWKNVNRKQSILKGLTIAVMEASESGKIVSPLPSK